MTVTINITGEAIDELNDIVASINAENNTTTITAQQWVQNLVQGHLDDRIRGEMVYHTRHAPIEALKQKLGSARELRKMKVK